MKEKIKEWFKKIFQKKHNDAVIKDRVKDEIGDDPDYRYYDFRDEIIQVEKTRKKI